MLDHCQFGHWWTAPFYERGLMWQECVICNARSQIALVYSDSTGTRRDDEDDGDQIAPPLPAPTALK